MKTIYEKDLKNQQWKEIASPEQVAFYEWAVTQGSGYAFQIVEYNAQHQIVQRLRIILSPDWAYLMQDQWTGSQLQTHKKVLLKPQNERLIIHAFDFKHPSGEASPEGAYLALSMFENDLPARSTWIHNHLNVSHWQSESRFTELMALLAQVLAEEPMAHTPLLPTVATHQPLRTIETVRSLDAINAAVQAGFRTVLKSASPCPPFYTKDVLLRHRDTGLYQLRSRLKPTEISLAWETVKPLSYCPPVFKEPFAAYVVPADIQVGERVYIKDVIEDLLGGIDPDTGSEQRLNDTYGRWNGEDFYLEHPDLPPADRSHWVECTIYCNRQWLGIGRFESKPKNVQPHQMRFFYETEAAEAEAAYRFFLTLPVYYSDFVTLYIKGDTSGLVYNTNAQQENAAKPIVLSAQQTLAFKALLANVNVFERVQHDLWRDDEDTPAAAALYALRCIDSVWQYCAYLFVPDADTALQELYAAIKSHLPATKSVELQEPIDKKQLRTIATVRSINALNKGVKAGYTPLIENVVCCPPFKEETVLGWNALSQRYGYCSHPARYYRDYQAQGWQIVLNTSYYPALFKTGFAAYLLPPDLEPGERVWIKDLITDLLGGGNASVGVEERQKSAYARWNGESFDIEYHPEEILFAIG